MTTSYLKGPKLGPELSPFSHKAFEQLQQYSDEWIVRGSIAYSTVSFRGEGTPEDTLVYVDHHLVGCEDIIIVDNGSIKQIICRGEEGYVSIDESGNVSGPFRDKEYFISQSVLPFFNSHNKVYEVWFGGEGRRSLVELQRNRETQRTGITFERKMQIKAQSDQCTRVSDHLSTIEGLGIPTEETKII